MSLDDIVWKLKADRDGYNEQQDEETVMDKELYQAAFRGQTSFLSDGAHDDTYFTMKTSEVRENIIHIAVQQEKLEFASEGARRFPKLICEGNCDNNTPLHFAAKTGNLNIMKRLIDSYMDFVNESKLVDVIPWRVKNKEGNTPLHVALARGEISIAEYLLEVAPKLARIRNNLMETPLHLAVKYNGNFQRVVDTLKVEVQVQRKFVTLKDYPKQVKEDSLDIISSLMRTEPSVACWRDTNGVTPLLQAVLLNPPDLAAVEVILDWCPQSASVCDSTTGNTILHYLIVGCRFITDCGFDRGLKFDLPDLFCRFPEIVGLKYAQNFVGDTPSHIAVKKESDVSLRLLMNVKADLTVENKDGVYVADLILQNPKFKSHLKYTREWFENYHYTFVDGNIIKSHDYNKPKWRSEIERAIRNVNLSFLREMLNDSSGLDHLMRYSVIHRNILHALVPYSKYKVRSGRVSYHDFVNVVKQVLEALPFLFCQTNNQDQNLLHRMAIHFPEMIDESMLELCRNCVEKLEIEAGIATIFSPPWRGLDINGNTPLHSLINHASSLKISHQIKVFISFDSTLAECTNSDGMTPIQMLCGIKSENLDMEEENEVLKDMSIILDSTDYHIFYKRDKDGMTPLLKASKSECFTIVRSILEQSTPYLWSYDCYLPNGQSYMHLIACTQVSESNYRQIREILLCGSHRADFYHQDKEGNTPLHLAIEEGNFLFVKLFITESVSTDSTLIKELYTQNANRQTCLHLIANSTQGSNNDCLELLQEVKKLVLELPDVDRSDFLEALCLQDKDGNTALHLAIEKGYFLFVKLFVTESVITHSTLIKILCTQNANGQTCLHLIANSTQGSNNDCLELLPEVKKLVLQLPDFDRYDFLEALCLQDKDGNTALHLAIEKSNFLFIKLFITESVSTLSTLIIKILYTQNANRQTCLHLIANSTQESNKDCQELLQEVEKLVLQVPDVNLSNFHEALCCKDKDGNTALHLAIQKQNFRLAQFCITTGTTATTASNSYRNILEIRNIKNISPGDLIGSAENLPNEFEQFLWSKPEVVKGMLGFRSLTGIPTTMIKDYVNTLGVTAALLATITFTTAFTVPGGLNSANGTPLLMKKASFQVFMISDIMAMCLSIMVLFCLLWIMTIGDKKKSVVLLDLTVLLLETSFYMTLLTFMTGLYVTTFPITPWIAILGCGLCSLLVLLMHKPFITGIIPSFIRMFVWSRKVYLSVTGELKHKFSCCRTNRNTVQGNHNSDQPQADSDANALMVMPPSDMTELMTGSRPTSAHMITIDSIQ